MKPENAATEGSHQIVIFNSMKGDVDRPQTNVQPSMIDARNKRAKLFVCDDFEH